jgi:hypothetical protein
MGVHPLRLSRVGIAQSAALLVMAKLNGSQANITPLF